MNRTIRSLCGALLLSMAAACTSVQTEPRLDTTGTAGEDAITDEAGAPHSRPQVRAFQGRFQGHDPFNETIAVRNDQEVVVFHVKSEGPLVSRTTAKINGVPTNVTELPVGGRVIVYWIPDQSDPKARFARTVDMPFSPEN